jgi:hypothetical protein
MSGQQQGSLILRSGLNEVYDTGVYPNFALKYFLPVYDPRLDLEIHDLPLTTPTSAIQNSASVFNVDTASSAFSFGDIEGEMLWNYTTLEPNYQYRIDYTGNIVTNVTADPTGTMSAATTMNSKTSRANYIYNTSTSANVGRPQIGTPFSSAFEQYTADNVTSSGDGNFTSTTNFAAVAEVGTVPASYLASNLYDTISYISNEGNPDNYGVYQLRLPANTGSFQFNKLVLFGQKVDTQGDDEVGANPFPFAVVALNNVQAKLSSEDSNNSNNVTEFIADIAIAFTRSTSGASEITYNPEEYWTRIKTLSDGTSALEYPGSVLVSPITGGINEESPKSKLHIIEDDTDKHIVRFSRQESSEGNDGILSINPDTSAVELYAIGAGQGFQLDPLAHASGSGTIAIGPDTSAIGNYSLAYGDSVSLPGHDYTVLIGKDANMLPSPPASPCLSIAVEATDISSFNSISLLNKPLADTPLAMLDSIVLHNNGAAPNHSMHQFLNSMANVVVPNASRLFYNVAISNTLAATISGTDGGVESALTIGAYNNYEHVTESITVGDYWSFQGPVDGSIIVGTKPSGQFDPAFAGSGNFGTSGTFILSHSAPGTLLYNTGYDSCFIMGNGHIVGGGLQSSADQIRNTMHIEGFGNMIACDYSYNFGSGNILNAAETQISHSSAYNYNFVFGRNNKQEGIHTATSSHNFNQGITTIGSGIYTEDCKSLTVIGGNYDAASTAAANTTFGTFNNSYNDIRQTTDSLIVGYNHSSSASDGIHVFGNTNLTKDSSLSFMHGSFITDHSTLRASSFGISIFNQSVTDGYAFGSAITNSNSTNIFSIGNAIVQSNAFTSFHIGSACQTTWGSEVWSMGSSNTVLGTSDLSDNEKITLFGVANSVLNAGNSYITLVGQGNNANTNVVNSYAFGVSNSTNASDNAYQFGYSGYVHGGSSYSYLFGHNNEIDNGSYQGFVLGMSSNIDNASYSMVLGKDSIIKNLGIYSFSLGKDNDIDGGQDNYQVGINNTTSASSTTFVHGQSNAITSASGAYVFGTTNTMNKDEVATSMSNNFMFGVANDIDAGDSAGSIDNSFLIGLENSITNKTFQQDGNVNLAVMIGYQNTASSIGGSSPSPTLASTPLIGTANNVYAGAYSDIENSIVIGAANTLKATGSVSDTDFTGVQVLGYGNTVEAIPAAAHDATVRDELGLTVVGSYGDTGDLTSITKLFKVWDNLNGGDVYSANTDTIVNGFNTMNVLITNGFGLGNEANAIGIGIVDGGVDSFRQLIVLPTNFGSTAGDTATTNPMNPSNPKYAMPSHEEIETMNAAGFYVPQGTLCYDKRTSASNPEGMTPLYIYSGSGV